MTINENNSAKLKVSLLSKGINFNLDLFRNYKKAFYDNQFVYGKTSKYATPNHKFPQVLLLGDGVITALLRREDSPWNLKIVDQELILLFKDRFIKKVGLPERPPYFDKYLRDGTLSQSIIAVAGEDIPGFFFYPYCFYFSEGSPCSFCSLKDTRITVGKHMISEFNEEQIVEATRLFQNTHWRSIPLISITTGTTKTDEDLRQYVVKPIKIMYDTLDPKIPIHVLAHPPNSFSIIEEFKKAGVTSIAFNLEIFDKYIFEHICPGKSKYYSYTKWVESLEYARYVFGDFNAYCGLVWGFEPYANIINGYEYFLDKKIGIASNIWHADPKCIQKNHPHPSEAYILEIAKAQDELYSLYPDAKTIFPVSMRSTIDWEIYKGFFR